MQPLMHMNDILHILRTVSQALDNLSQHLEQLPRNADTRRLDHEALALRRQLARTQRAALDAADYFEAHLDEEE